MPPGGSQPPDWRGASGYAVQLGFADGVDFWGMVGLLHDIDFELYPEEHCIKAPELLREGGVGEDMIHAICSHGYGLHVDVKLPYVCAGES